MIPEAVEKQLLSEENENEKNATTKSSQDESFDSKQHSNSNLFDSWHPYLHYPSEILRTIRASGSNGASIRDLYESCSGLVTKKTAPRVVDALLKAYPDEIKIASEEKLASKNRSLRMFKYYSSKFQHAIEESLREFEELSGGCTIDVGTDSFFTGRTVKRINAVLKTVQQKKVTDRMELSLAIRDAENGNYERLDGRILTRILDFLKKRDLLKEFICDIRDGEGVEIGQITLYVLPDIDENHELIRAAKEAHIKPKDAESIVAEPSVSSTAEVIKPINKPIRQNIRNFISNELLKKWRKLQEEENAPTAEGDDKESRMTALTSASTSVVWGKNLLKAVELMTYVPENANIYGKQKRHIRCQILHTLLAYLKFNYQGKNMDDSWSKVNEPFVYLDVEDWRRFLPPIQERKRFPIGWLSIQEIAERLPLSLFVQLIPFKYQISGLDAWLEDPIKRHWLVSDLPESLRAAVWYGRRDYISLDSLMQMLCLLKLVSAGPAIDSKHEKKNQQMYYLHRKVTIYDTSNAPKRFETVEMPLDQYQAYSYDFVSDDPELFWLHLRAISISTPLNYRHETCDDDRKVHEISVKRRYCEDIMKQTRMELGTEQSESENLELINGAAGVSPFAFLYYATNWVLVTNKYADWFSKHYQELCDKYHSIIRERVTCLNSSWRSDIRSELLSRKGWLRKRGRPHPKPSPGPNQTTPPKKKVAGKEGLTAALAPRGKRQPDAVDMNAIEMHSKERLRNRFSQLEGELLFALKALSKFLIPISKFAFDAATMRDVMHKFVPESRTKTALSMSTFANRFLLRNPEIEKRFDVLQHKFNGIPELMAIRFNVSILPKTKSLQDEEKNELFKQAADIVWDQLFKNDSLSVTAELPENYEELIKRFNIAPAASQIDSFSFPDLQEDIESENKIKAATLCNVIVSSLASSRNDGLSEILQQFSDSMLADVMQQLLDKGLVSIRKPDYRRTSSIRTETTGRQARDFILSSYYRSYFYHKFVPQIASEASHLYEKVVGEPEKSHSVVGDYSGHASVCATMMLKEQAQFDIRIPDNFVIFNDDQETQVPSSEGTDEQRNSSTSASVGPSAPAEVPEGPTIMNKSLLVRIRNDQMKAVDRALANKRGLPSGVIVPDVHFVPLEILLRAKPKSVLNDLKSLSAESTFTSLLRYVPLELPDFSKFLETLNLTKNEKNLLNNIFTVINESGSIGLKMNDLVAKMADEKIPEEKIRLHLKTLIDAGHVLRVGIQNHRYCATANADPWLVKSIKMRKEKQTGDGPAAKKPKISKFELTRTEPVRFIPKPWLKSDGSINMPMLRWQLEGVLLLIMAKNGASEERLISMFGPVLQPCLTLELAEFLVEQLGAVRRIEYETIRLTHRNPFDVEETIKNTVTYCLADDAVTRIGMAFEGIKLPDFADRSSPA